MIPLLYPDVNGARVSYSSIEFGMAGVRIPGIKSISYKETADIPKQWGTSRKPIGRTAGKFDFEGDVEFYAAEFQQAITALGALGVVGFSEIGIPISVTYAELISPETIATDILIGVRLHSPERSHSEGPDALTVKMTMSIMDIQWGGVGGDLLQGTRSLPL